MVQPEETAWSERTEKPERTARRRTPKPALFRKTTSSAPGPSLQPGCRVRHKVFGDGVILSVSGHGVGRRARVRFDKVGDKTLVLQYAHLKPC